jgi:hypothetical protein
MLLVGLLLGGGLGFWLGRQGTPTGPQAPLGAAPAANEPPHGAHAPHPPPAPPDVPSRPATPQERAEAIEAGLAWLEEAQEHDGSWDLVRWNPWHGRTGLHGFSEEDHWFQPGATGLALLAMLEARPAADAPNAAMLRGLKRLVAWQREDGRIGHDELEVDAWFVKMLGAPGFEGHGGPGYKALTIHAFNHAVAMAALAVAASRPEGEAWRDAARKALAHCVADEHPEYSWSAYLDPESDIGVVAYVALAARAGVDLGLTAEAGPLVEALPHYLERVTDPATGRTRMLAEVPVCFDGDDSTAINAYARRLLRQDPASSPLSLALASLAARSPRWAAAVLPEPEGVHAFEAHLGAVVNHDAWTYGVRALEGASGEAGRAWRDAVRALLVRNQVRSGPHAGSWEPIGVWDRVGGRLYATAMGVRCLAGP